MRGGSGRPPRTALPLHERAIFAYKQVEMGALLVGKLEKDLLAFRILEPLAVLLEESVRTALAADAYHQRLLVVHASKEALGALGEEPVRGTLEKQECRPRLQLRIALKQRTIARLQLTEMFLFLLSEILKNLSATRVAGDARRPAVELKAAPLRCNRNMQRVARKQKVTVAIVASGRSAGPTLLTGPIDLDHAL
jgi:hypothetical protein